MKRVGHVYGILTLCLLGCAADASPGASLASDTRFWQQFEIDGHWAEYYPTLSALADGADAVLLARVTRVEPAIVTQGEAAEDVVIEAALQLAPRETLRGSPPDTPSVTLVLPRVASRAQASALLDKLELPVEPALFFLRARAPALFRVVNGHGLWARTTRRALDTPLIRPDEPGPVPVFSNPAFHAAFPPGRPRKAST